MTRRSDYGPSSLTTAELRVLQLLPTHLSVREIADRLYVSRNTVKSQTIAIYRKLGTSSRRGAIEIAVVAGLLADAVPPLSRRAGADQPRAVQRRCSGVPGTSVNSSLSSK